MSTANWYHCHVKTISRGKGRYVVAAIAYRTGERYHDRRYDLTHDYTRRRGVECHFSFASKDAPEWAFNPGELWNAVEERETKRNACLARELELALPAFLPPQARREIAERIAAALVSRYGVAGTVAIHEPGRHGDDRNYHAHIVFTTRELDAGGFGEKVHALARPDKRDPRRRGPQEINHIRQLAADVINDVLREHHSDIRVDPRSFKDRGIDREPTTHLGPIAAEIERDGRESHRGRENREIERSNAELAALGAERDALDKAIEAERERLSHPPATPEDARERLSDYILGTSPELGEQRERDLALGLTPLTAWQRRLYDIALAAHEFVSSFGQRVREVWRFVTGGPEKEPSRPEPGRESGPSWASRFGKPMEQDDWRNRISNNEPEKEIDL